MPFPAGGPTDGMARIISDRLGAVLGQSIVIENRGGGAGGSIGAKVVASGRSRRLHHPDHAGRIADQRPGRAQEHRLRSGQGVHAGRAAHRPTPLILTRASGAAGENAGRACGLRQGQSRQDHLRLARLRHRAASAHRVVQARNRRQHRSRALSRHARRCSPPCSAGEIQMFFDPPTTILPHIQSGKVRADRRDRAPSATEIVPDVPTMAEAGFPKLQSPFWLGVVAPAGTPPAIVDKLNAAFRESLDAAGDARAARRTSAPRSRSARRMSSARCSPRNWRCGPASARPRTSRWSDGAAHPSASGRRSLKQPR